MYDSYGKKCNHRFLLNYGFAIENNIESDGRCPNEIYTRFSIPKSDPFRSRKVLYNLFYNSIVYYVCVVMEIVMVVE